MSYKLSKGKAKLALLLLLLPIAAPAQEHKFWDKPNLVLFSAVTVSHALDVDSTWRFRAHGDIETTLSNSFVDNKPAFAAYSLGLSGANVLGAYLAHRTGHHRIERAISIVHIGGALSSSVRNYRLY